MPTFFDTLTVASTAVLCGLSLALLFGDRLGAKAPVQTLLRRWRRVSPVGELGRFDLILLSVLTAVVYAAVVAYDLAGGLYSCPGGGGYSDLQGLLRSGEAFTAGLDPFTVASCGATVHVPYGLAAVLVDALGSLGGAAGIAAVWGAIALSLLPLTAWVAGPERRYLVWYVALSPLYVPLIASQIDGAANAILPMAVLLSLGLAASSRLWGQAVGGLLATARFPAIFPIVALAGPGARRFLRGGLAFGSFALGTLVAYALWGNSFYHVVFAGQLTRRSFSLNAYGLLIDHHWLPAELWVVGVQAALVLAVLAVAFFRGRTPVQAAAIALVGVALTSQFLSFNILIGLLPVALVGARARWWLWGVSVAAALDYYLAFQYLAAVRGLLWPGDLLDLVVTALLIALFLEVLRTSPRGASGGPATGTAAAEAAPTASSEPGSG